MAFAVATKMVKKKEGITEEDAISESYFKVTIPELPPFFLDAKSRGEVKSQLRDMMKPEAYKNLSIERATKSEMQKLYRQLAKEPQSDKSVEEAVKVDGQNKLKEKKDSKMKTHFMGDSHWEGTDELVQYLRKLTPGEISKKGIKEEDELDETIHGNLEHLRNILKGKSAKALKFSNGTMKVDSFSAAAIISVYDKVNEKNQDMLHKLINGSKEDFIKASDIAFKIINKSKK